MKHIKFNQDWKFWKNNNSFALIWDVPAHATDVTLPHDAMILEPASEESANSNNTGFRDGATYVYVKTITPAKEDENKQLKLKFEGVYSNACVYVNEQLAAKSHFGYSTFYVDLNDFLRFGEENEIRVVVLNGMMTNSRWYTGSGIYRDVYLLESGLVYIQPEGVQVTTKQLDSDFAQLEVHTELVNSRHLKANVIVENQIYLGGKLCASETSALALMGSKGETLRQVVGVEQPQAWNDQSPTLYRMETHVYIGGECVGSATTTFGIRTISVDAKYGLRVNGQSLKLRGACIHHDSGLLGAKTYYDFHYRQIKKLKQAGFNAIRMAHQPMAPAMVKCCDELGMYVMDETFDMWTRNKSDYDYSMFFSEHWQQDVLAMIRKNFNSPSVIMYSIGNEIPEIGTDHGAKLCREMSEFVKKYDPTRFTLASINGVFATGDKIDQIVNDVSKELIEDGVLDGHVNHFMQLMGAHMDRIVTHDLITQRLEKAIVGTDIAGYNYMGARYELDKESYPNRVIVGSETYPPAIGREWPVIMKNSNVIGDFTWTGWDYIGEAGVGIPAYNYGEGGFAAKFPAQLSYCSDFNLIGSRRPASYFREIVYGLRSDPYIVVQNPSRYDEALIKTPWVISDALPCWTYPERTGKPVVVEVYTPGDKVELILNGEVLETRPLTESDHCKVVFDVTYQPGKLEAVCYQNNEELGRHCIETNNQLCKIESHVEYGQNQELAFVEIELHDENGNLIINEQDLLEIEVEGSGTLAGFGSGDPKPLHNYLEGKIHVFQGKALAILQLNGKVKRTVIRLSYNGLEKTLEV